MLFSIYRARRSHAIALIDPMLLKSRCIVNRHIMPARTVSSRNIVCFYAFKKKERALVKTPSPLLFKTHSGGNLIIFVGPFKQSLNFYHFLQTEYLRGPRG